MQDIHIWLTTIVWYTLGSSLTLPNIYYSFLYYFIVFRNCKIRIINMREYLTHANSKNLFLRFNTIETIIRTSDKIFSDINTYNKYWRNYSQILFYFLTPYNLVTLNLTFNNNLMFFLRLINGSFMVFTLIINLVFNLSTV